MWSLRPTIIHYIDPVYWVQVLLIFYRKKSIMHVHGAFWSNPKSIRQRILWFISRKSITKFIAITHSVKDNLILHKFADKDKIDVVYNSIDIHKITSPIFDYEPPKNFKKIPSNSKIIGSVGRIVPGRGFDDLIRLLQFLEPHWCALIVGDGHYFEELKGLTFDLNLDNRVFFSGQVEDVVPYYKMMDVYGFFARYESFGLALADAMLLGKPIFGLQGAGEYTDQRYPLITNMNSTFIMRPNYLDQWRRESDETLMQLAEKINDYELTPNEYKTKRDNAFNHVTAKFNLKLQTSKVLSIYESLI